MAKNNHSANVGFEDKLWQAADKMRGHMDPGEYKHVVLGLLFLKYISDSFETRRSQLLAELQNPESDLQGLSDQDQQAVLEERDEYLAYNVFWVVPQARWFYLRDNAKTPKIGQLVDEAMLAIEKENPRLKGVLPKNFGRPELDKTRLGELIDLVSTIGLGDDVSRQKDVLGRVYEYFLSRFASQEGKGGGEFYTPAHVVRLLVAMLEPYRGRVYDPCCGSGGMFVQSEKFVAAHGGRIGDISIFGQESNPTTWRLAQINLAIRGIDANLGSNNADSFHSDLHPDLKADFVLANPPFNDSDWGGERLQDDQRWVYGVPPAGNANFAWVQHFIHHLSPRGKAGFVLANGSMSSNTSNEGNIRQAIVEADLVDCMVALPGQLFYSTQIPVCLWFLNRSKARPGETLFIDARKMGSMADRTHRELTDEDIQKIADTYHAWLKSEESYQDIPGFCKCASQQEIGDNNFILTPGRYVGIKAVQDDGEPFEEKIARLSAQLYEQFAESARLEAEIRKILEELGYGE